jgi:hypothetical protein
MELTLTPRGRWSIAFTLGLVLVAATALPTLTALGATKPKAWIDQPLPGSMLPLGPTPVLVHLASDSGIGTVRFLIDGIPAATTGAPAGDLVVVEWSWQPVEVGQHLLTVVAESTEGMAADPVSVGVTFMEGGLPTETAGPGPSPSTGASAPPPPTDTGASPTPTLRTTSAPTVTPTASPTQKATATPRPTPTPTPRPTPTPTPRPTPTPTPRPTPTPCSPPAPTLDGPADGAHVDAASLVFTWFYRPAPSCAPTRFRIRINDADGNTVLSRTVPGDEFSYHYETSLGVLQGCVPYSWRVLGLDTEGQAGPSSSERTFSLVARACP